MHAHADPDVPIRDAGIAQIPVVTMAQTTTSPPVTTFSDTSKAAPALAQFRGATYIAWSGTGNGSLNVAAITKGRSGYQLTSKVTLNADLSPGLSPALAVFGGRLYLAFTGTDHRLNVECSTDGKGFHNKVTLGDKSNTGPTLAAFGGRLYLAFTGTDGHINVESSANGMRFSNHVTLNDSSFFSPSLAAYRGRLYLAFTGTNTALNVESSTNGIVFGDKVTLNQTSAAAPALTVESPAVKGQLPHLVLGWTGTGNSFLNCMTSTNGQQFGGLVTFKESGLKGLAFVSPSPGKLDFAWTGTQGDQGNLNFMQV
jgi:hypothetical protein